jgi:hypothetical protein
MTQASNSYIARFEYGSIEWNSLFCISHTQKRLEIEMGDGNNLKKLSE